MPSFNPNTINTANTVDFLKDVRQEAEATLPYRDGDSWAAVRRCTLIVDGIALPIAEALETMDFVDAKMGTFVAEAEDKGDSEHVGALCMKLRSDTTREWLRQTLVEIIEEVLLPSLAEGGVGVTAE